MNDEKLEKAIGALDHALSYVKKIKQDDIYMAAIAKRFEICFEYAWKYFKRRTTSEGLEVYGPKDAIKMAGKLKLIDDVELWMTFLDDRNLAVHDYLGLEDSNYLKTIQRFAKEVRRVK